MIKIENAEVVGWEAAIRGMRNPMNSWAMSDSAFVHDMTNGEAHDICGNTFPYNYKDDFDIGKDDLRLMNTLALGGSTHAKYRRMITVYADITAPLYLLAELDTYKVGTVRNSCSFMHKGVSKPFSISDFSVKDKRVYDVLLDFEEKVYIQTYPYETTEYKTYVAPNGRKYKVYRNGMIIREAFDYVDNYGTGRKRHFDASFATVYQDREGYYVVKLSGRNQKSVCLHRLVAELWCDKPEGATQVNHIDGNKGNNCAENLEWVTPLENMQKSMEAGLHDNLFSLHKRYKSWKISSIVLKPKDRMSFGMDVNNGLTYSELAEKYGMTPKQANQCRYTFLRNENEELFEECYVWESIIDHLNYLRELYLITKDEKIFQTIRSILPQGYMQRSTYMFNYEVLHNIYTTRRNHRLDEWRTFCEWIESLPLAEDIIFPEIAEMEDEYVDSDYV